MTDGRTEHVLADLTGPGTITRFWTANPSSTNIIRFYFNGEDNARISIPFKNLFNGETTPFDSVFSYISGTGGNLYYPIPYSESLKITIEEKEKPIRLYYEIGYRTYPVKTNIETFNPKKTETWADTQIKVIQLLSHPEEVKTQTDSELITKSLTIASGESLSLPEIRGEKAIYSLSARIVNTQESSDWDEPYNPHNAYRNIILSINFDGEKSIYTPLGDFFGSAPGVNPYENLFFTVNQNGWMTSRLIMPFKESGILTLTNAGSNPLIVELKLRVGTYNFTDRSYHLRAQWGTVTRDSWPPFDINFLNIKGEGKVIGTVYQIANPSHIWWGEGDQKIFIDQEAFPSSFGTGTEDDYGYAYGNNRTFIRPYHAQTRVDGPASGGHISLNRWYVLDAIPYQKAIRFVQEMWHWMPCKPTWNYVVYWYAEPGTQGPSEIDLDSLNPRDLGNRENMLDLIEGENLVFSMKSGSVQKERLANCSGASHLVWRNGNPGDHLNVSFEVPEAGLYSVTLNLCMSPEYGNYKFKINDIEVEKTFNAYSPELYWMQSLLGLFELKQGKNYLEVELLNPNPLAKAGNLFGLDYIFLVKQE